MAVLATLQPDARAAARLTDALSGAHEVLMYGTWEALERGLTEGQADTCLIDIDYPDRSSAGLRVQALHDRYPNLGIVACVEPDAAPGYFDLGGLGVDGVVVTGSGAAKLRADLDVALATTRGRRIERTLERILVAPGPAAVAWAVENAGPDASVKRLAAALGYTPRSLRDNLHQVGLPSPARLLLWGRLLLAGARLGEDRRRVEEVAFSLGYSTAKSLARAMRVHAGLTPAEIARSGGMEAVCGALFPDHARGGDHGALPPRRSPIARLTLLCSAVVLAGCATLTPSGTPVDGGAIEMALAATPLDQMHVGIMAMDANTGGILFAHEAKRRFVPASNQKILSTATALSMLGADHRFRTEAWVTAAVEGSSTEGDLIVIAMGDPSLSGRYWPSGTSALDALADSLYRGGLRRVGGSALVDVSAWDSTSVGPTWEVADMQYAYGSTGGAFAIDEGEIEVVVTAGPTVGSPAAVQWSPIGTDDFVRSRVRTTSGDSTSHVVPSYLPESRQLVLEGVSRLGSVDTLAFAIRDPVHQAAAAFWRALIRAGIEVEGGWGIKWSMGEAFGYACAAGMLSECGSASLLTAIESPPLSEITAGILGPSQNWMAEQLVHILGERFGNEGSWSMGMRVIEAHVIGEMGVDSLDISGRDGSGRSAYNLVTPRALVRILTEMLHGPYGGEYRSAMAQPGLEGSTLEDRLRDLEGRLYAKTGTISNVNSLSGYLVTGDGQEIVFSILVNGSGGDSLHVSATIDEIVRILAR